MNREASPAGFDVVQVIEYDERGRKPKTYLPYVSGSTDGSYQSNWNSNQAAFYQTTGDQIANTAYPYSESRFESSPLNRPLEQGAPGQEWQLGNHTISTLFETNAANEVIRWELNSNGELTEGGYYAANTLTVNVVINESGYQTREYLDKRGNVKLRKTQGDNGMWLETYYVQDDYGNLRFVLPPLAVDQLNGGTTVGDCGPEEDIQGTTVLTSYQGKSYRIAAGANLKTFLQCTGVFPL